MVRHAYNPRDRKKHKDAQGLLSSWPRLPLELQDSETLQPKVEQIMSQRNHTTLMLIHWPSHLNMCMCMYEHIYNTNIYMFI